VIKEEYFDSLIFDMGNCKRCIELKNRNGKDCSLINIYKDNKFAKKIPSIWTDWYNRLNSEIIIVGQDWGPYLDMKKFNDLYLKNPTKANWKDIIEKEQSLTKKQLTKFLIESSNGKLNSIDNIYITNAIMCARKGENYRGNNINLKNSTINCASFLKKQIDIVKPKVILTLGYYPLLALSCIFNFSIEKTLKESIKKTPTIEINNYIIIPLYHPVAQIKKEEQLSQYRKIWNYIKL